MEFFKKIMQSSREKELTKDAFEDRYQRLILQKEEERLKDSLAGITAQNLKSLQKVTNRAKALSYYEGLFAHPDSREEEIRNFKGEVIGTFCNFVPEELIYAAGCIPLRLCAGFYDTIHPAEEILPRDICPLIKSSLGFKISKLSYFELCKVIVFPVSCDGKKKLGEILNFLLPVWTLEVPQNKDRVKSKDFWLSEVKILKRRLERLTGHKITKQSLRQAIEFLGKRQKVFHRLYELRKHNPPLISGRDALLVTQASFYDDINRWIQKTEELCEELRNQKPGIRDQKLRLLVTGAPIIWPNFKLLNIIEEADAVIVIDELCSGTRHLYDPVRVDEWTEEGMLKAIAERYLFPSTCPCFVENHDRIDKLLQMAEDFSIDGVIYHSLRLCQLYDLERGLVRQVLKSKGIPVLNVYTDYSSEDVEQIKTRVEAFLEMVSSKKR